MNQFPTSPFNFEQNNPQQYQGMSQGYAGLLPQMMNRPTRPYTYNPNSPEARRAAREKERERLELAKKRNRGFNALGFLAPTFPLFNKLFSDTDEGGWGGGAAVSRFGDSVVERMAASDALTGHRWSPGPVTSRIFGGGGGGDPGYGEFKSKASYDITNQREQEEETYNQQLQQYLQNMFRQRNN